MTDWNEEVCDRIMFILLVAACMLAFASAMAIIVKSENMPEKDCGIIVAVDFLGVNGTYVTLDRGRVYQLSSTQAVQRGLELRAQIGEYHCLALNGSNQVIP